MIHQMKLNPKPFAMIASGKKTVELRLNDPKRRLLKKGDEIVFTQTETGESLRTRVQTLYACDSFQELFGKLDLSACGYAEGETEKALADMNGYYTPEQQEKWGVLGIKLKVL